MKKNVNAGTSPVPECSGTRYRTELLNAGMSMPAGGIGLDADAQLCLIVRTCSVVFNGKTTNTAQLKSRYFRHQEGLTRHRRKLHSDQKSFRCSQCAAAFAFNYDLTRHMRRAHRRPPPPPETAGDQQLVEEGEVVYLCQPPVETAAVFVGGRIT
jgi:hypothetical protein